MIWEVIATLLQLRDSEGLNLGSDHGNIKGGRPELSQRYSHQWLGEGEKKEVQDHSEDSSLGD